MYSWDCFCSFSLLLGVRASVLQRLLRGLVKIGPLLGPGPRVEGKGEIVTDRLVSLVGIPGCGG